MAVKSGRDSGVAEIVVKHVNGGFFQETTCFTTMWVTPACGPPLYNNLFKLNYLNQN